MIAITQTRTLLLGLLIIILSNAVLLGGVAYNRAGEATSQIQLTERELKLPYRYGFAAENSGIALRLDWRVFDSKKTHAYYSRWYPTEWLDADKLSQLGFDVSYPLNKHDSYEHYQKALSREVFLLFEYDGPTYQQVLQQRQHELDEAKVLQQQNPDKQKFMTRLKKATVNFEAEQDGNSRLFAIDAGLDANALRQHYPDNRQYLIARGQIRLNYQGRHDKTPYLSGAIQQLSVMKVNVPKQHASIIQTLLDDLNQRSRNHPPRFAVNLNYGQRFEPWVESVKGL